MGHLNLTLYKNNYVELVHRDTKKLIGRIYMPHLNEYSKVSVRFEFPTEVEIIRQDAVKKVF